MLMSVVEGARWAPAYPELAGKRVLVTGLSSSCGVDVARAFADHKVRLILQFADPSDEAHAIAEIAAPHASTSGRSARSRPGHARWRSSRAPPCRRSAGSMP